MAAHPSSKKKIWRRCLVTLTTSHCQKPAYWVLRLPTIASYFYHRRRHTDFPKVGRSAESFWNNSIFYQRKRYFDENSSHLVAGIRIKSLCIIFHFHKLLSNIVQIEATSLELIRRTWKLIQTRISSPKPVSQITFLLFKWIICSCFVHWIQFFQISSVISRWQPPAIHR